MLSTSHLDPRTPILVGVGQSSERVDEASSQGLSPVGLAIEAAKEAVADSGADPVAVAAAIDVVAATRQFEISTPVAFAPLGKSTNVPRSIARGIGADPARAVLEVTGGQGPQHLVNEFGDLIARGEADVVLLAGAEAISTIRHLSATVDKPDFGDNPGGTLEDRGFGLRGVATVHQVRHGLTDAPTQYALLEHARRSRLGLNRADYAATMGKLFAPFTEVAAGNPHSAAPEQRTADELVTVTERNRLIADPYPRFLIARDQVNQGAAVLMMSLAAARRLGVPEDRWVFVHGHADLVEREILDRPDLGDSPAAVEAVKGALHSAGISVDDLSCLDLYSCFPIAVSVVSDALGLSTDDPRGLTVTGGLPFFGGAGNNYSMHAITEVIGRVRSSPGSFGLVGANGGMLSKYSAGVYSTTPVAWTPVDDSELQARLDAVAPATKVLDPQGWATIETYTVVYSRSGPRGVVIGRLESDGRRFLAQTIEGDNDVVSVLQGNEEPLGQRVYVRSFGYGNRVALTRERADILLPPAPVKLRDDYEHVEVRRDGHVLEITLNRPQARNALHAAANIELEQIFDAYFADTDLWVAIITGSGDRAFCAGNDLTATASGGLTWFPDSGFAGLTSRRSMQKPVIAAVNGVAMGGGFEIVLACHLAVADEDARFALPEVKVGLYAAAGGVVRLPRDIPRKIAHEMILTGRQISAQEALELGLVSRLVPAGTVMEAARALAAEIVAVSPTSVRLSLQVMDETRGIADDVEAVRFETDAMDQLLISQDTLEGIMAFAEKRPPVWMNR